MMSRSIQVPAFQAATTPIGTATVTARTRVTAMSDRVGPMRCSIMVQTGRLVKIEVPMSPCRMRHDHSPKRTRNGRSRPRFWRMRSTSGDVAEHGLALRRLRHAPEKGQGTLHHPGDVPAPGLVAEEEAGRAEHHVL